MKCLQCGKELTTGDAHWLCRECEQKRETNPPMLTGWICPRCGKVHSPFSMQCDCPPPCKTWTGTGTELNP